VVGTDKELIEKLGGNDPCPCGSGRRFQAVLPGNRATRWRAGRLLRPRLTQLPDQSSSATQYRPHPASPMTATPASKV